MKENLKYMKEVLGVKHLPKPTKRKTASEEKEIARSMLAEKGMQHPHQGKTLEQLQTLVKACYECKLGKTRTNTVFGGGNPHARLMFIGEGPGESEDLQGLPFVGRAGQLLTKMIEAMGLTREDVYIANIVKCRPPNNRKPEKEEVQACEGYLFAQIELINPELIIALGATAMECLFKTEEKIGEKRGKILEYRNRKILITYHPAYLLRNPPAKKYVWDDLKVAMKELKLPLKNF